jgi:hypothetical protein
MSDIGHRNHRNALDSREKQRSRHDAIQMYGAIHHRPALRQLPVTGSSCAFAHTSQKAHDESKQPLPSLQVRNDSGLQGSAPDADVPKVRRERRNPNRAGIKPSINQRQLRRTRALLAQSTATAHDVHVITRTLAETRLRPQR